MAPPSREDGDRGTAEFLTAYMGLRQVGEEESRLRFESAAEGAGTVVDLRRAPGFWSGAEGVGTVHHVAFRAPDGAAQLECRSRIEQAGLGITPVVDRQYFQSVYFREPGGVLFEIATDPPGFTLDEAPGELGTHLKLPPRYEPLRARIEEILPPLRLPQAAEPLSGVAEEAS